jgi:hypothetical protein
MFPCIQSVDTSFASKLCSVPERIQGVAILWENPIEIVLPTTLDNVLILSRMTEEVAPLLSALSLIWKPVFEESVTV